MSLARCPRCLLHRGCVCARIPTLHPATRFVILRHRTERNRTTNTGRIAHLALPDSVLLEHGDEDGPADLAVLRAPDTWRLDADGPPWTPDRGRPRQLLVLDGTWGQVARMVRRLPALHGMPRMALPPPEPRLRMRLPPAEGMSTLEAVAAALRLLEGAEAEADALLAVYDRMTELVLAGSGKSRRPSG